MLNLKKLKRVYRTLRDDNDFARSHMEKLRFGFSFRGYKNFDFNSFESDEANLIDSFLPQHDLFIDIGANIGFYSCLARHRGLDVIAIEPNHNNCKFLLDNIKSNGFAEGVEFHECGLGEETDVLRLYGGKTAASLLANWSNADTDYYTTIYVTSLNKLLRGRISDERVFVKIDVEGFEYSVLQGASDLLNSTNPITFFVEITYSEHRNGNVNEKFLETFELFWSKGFICYQGRSNGDVITKENVVDFLNNKANIPSANGNYLFRKNV